MSSPTGAVFLSYAALYDYDWIAAERQFDVPMARDVGFAAFRPIYAWFEFLRGNTAQAIPLARNAIDEDPLDVWTRMNMQVYLQSVGRESEALEQLRRVLEIDERGDAAALPLMQALDSNKAFGDAPAHALFHLLCGDVDQGADWTERAIEERDLAILVYLRFALSKDLSESQRWPGIAMMLNLHAHPQQPGS